MSRSKLNTYKTVQEKRNAFIELTPDNQYKIWKDKLSQVLSLDIWNDAQRKHLESLNKAFNASLYTDENKKHLFFTNFGLAWWEKANMLFEKDQLIRIVGITDDYTVVENVPPSLEDPNCNCNRTYDFCSGLEDFCRPRSSTTPCNSSSNGCGVLWLNSCNGRCTLP